MTAAMRRARWLLLLASALCALPVPAQPDLAAQLQAAARSGGVVTVSESPPAGFAARLTISRGRTLTLRAAVPVTLEGNGAENGLRVLSGGRLVVEGPLTLTGYRIPIFVTQAEGFTARGLTIRNVRRTGILTGKTSNVLIEDCDVDASGAEEHAVYLSEGGTGLTVRGSRLVGGRGSAIQVNACPLRATRVLIEGNRLGPAGNAGINLAAVTGAVVKGNTITGTRQGVVAWNDGQGKRCACSQIDLRGQAVGPFNIHKSSRLVLLPGRRAAR